VPSPPARANQSPVATRPPPTAAPTPRTPPGPPPPGPPVTASNPPPVTAPVAPAPRPAPQPEPSAPPVAAVPSAAPLDFTALGTRLRETKAVGVLTKLSVKNQVDDLLEKFREYHKQQGAVTLAELRRSYDMLLLKLLSLLQDGDPPLAKDIDRSRAAIWDILADPRKFIESNLMAGASP
jgi:hypothetical protein